MRVLVADADEWRRVALVAVLAAEPDLEPCPPAATVGEVISTPGVDVVLLHGGLDRGHGPIDVVRATRVARGPAWVVLTDDVDLTDEVITAGAHGCLAASSTPANRSRDCCNGVMSVPTLMNPVISPRGPCMAVTVIDASSRRPSRVR